MLPIQRFEHFIEAHSAFFKAIAQNPKLNHSEKPMDVSEIGATYLIYQDEHHTIQCQYEIDDRHYNRKEVLRFIKKHQRREKVRLAQLFKEIALKLDLSPKA